MAPIASIDLPETSPAYAHGVGTGNDKTRAIEHQRFGISKTTSVAGRRNEPNTSNAQRILMPKRSVLSNSIFAHEFVTASACSRAQHYEMNEPVLSTCDERSLPRLFAE
jgi:hypothetical protein